MQRTSGDAHSGGRGPRGAHEARPNVVRNRTGAQGSRQRVCARRQGIPNDDMGGARGLRAHILGANSHRDSGADRRQVIRNSERGRIRRRQELPRGEPKGDVADIRCDKRCVGAEWGSDQRQEVASADTTVQAELEGGHYGSNAEGTGRYRAGNDDGGSRRQGGDGSNGAGGRLGRHAG